MGLLLSGFALAMTALTVPSTLAGALSVVRVSDTLPASLTSALPLVRLHFNQNVKATSLPALAIHPTLRTAWEQIGPREVQAVAIGTLVPSVLYRIAAPTQLRCNPRCAFSATQSRVTSVAANVTWEDQLLAELHYLPLSFQPSASANSTSSQVPGTFTWEYPNLPASLIAQWQVGTNNVILRGAVMAFQSAHGLATTGVADTTTWRALITAANTHAVDTSTYDFVNVSMALPETLTLYVAGRETFHTLVNTGISVSPTATGTYPVYLRYTSQTMSGTNPDGSHYSDPGIPWVSYFNGGDALHGFIRATYGWPQSLGCVEMPFASAKTVWPYTPIGTLVTVQA